MNDRPSPCELIDAVRLFLEKELLPAVTDPRLRFQTLVAANVLGIASREIPHEDEMLYEEWKTLSAFLTGHDAAPENLGELHEAVEALNVKLCERIQAGEFDGPEHQGELLAVLKHQVEAKLRVANPRYLAP